MPRLPRRHQQGEFHHVINRGNVRSTLFFDAADYRTFLDLLAKMVEKYPVGLLGYCVMPNHWHLVVVPATQMDLSRAMHWLTSTHVRWWARSHERHGPGHVYQSRFHSIPVQPGINVCRVLRYVERNALASDLAPRAEAWPWGSACQRVERRASPRLLAQSFLPPELWLEHLNAPVVDREVGEAIRRNLPIGDAAWVDARYAALGLSQARRPGRRSGSGRE